MHSPASRPATASRLDLSTCLAWGAGTVAVAALFNSVNVLLLRYVVDFAGVSAAAAGGLIGLSKIYDALIDPVIGAASDRTRAKSGRRRPFVLAGGLLLAVAALLLFNLPAGLSPAVAFGWFAVALVLYATAYATFSVPYMAMPAEMTADYHERSRLISFRVGGVAVASLLAVFVGPVLMSGVGGGRAGYTALSVMLAVLIVVASLYCFVGTRRAPFHYAVADSGHGWAVKAKLLLENRPFMLLLVVKLLQLMALAVMQAALPFMFKRILNLSDTALGLYFLCFYGTMILVQPLWVRSTKKTGKRNTFIVATVVYAAIHASWYFAAAGEPSAITAVRGAALGAVGGAVLLLGQSLLPDTMEWDYRRTGLRREGVLSAVYTIVEKVAFALGAALTGLVLGAAGYVQGTGAQAVQQPASALAAIHWLCSVFPAAFLLASLVALYFYRLDEGDLAGAAPVVEPADAIP
jgi:GPH family glycoside/pentoside/hexuronide:cation symporter